MKWLTLEDGSRWPDPESVAELAWLCRDNPFAAPEILSIAAALDAYCEITTRPEFRDKLPMIRRAMRAPQAPGGTE